MKIAYLITAYDSPAHLNRLILALNNKDVDFYIHIDKKSKAKFHMPKLSNIVLLKNNIPVFWGSYTFNEAVILMIKEAQKRKKYDYLSLISGADYPVRSNKYIIDYFKKNNGKEFINICRMPEDDKGFDRVEYYFISTIDRNNAFPNRIKRLVNMTIRKLNIKRGYPKEYRHLTLYGGSNWWTLSNDCVNYVLDFLKSNPNYVSFYKNTYIPEEMYFHTIIGNSPFYKHVTNAITYTDWSPDNASLPAVISKKHLKDLAKDNIELYGINNSAILFARKFNDNNEEIIKEIDRTIRSKK